VSVVPHHDITPGMSRVGFPQFTGPEYGATRRTTASTWAADTTGGLLHALNWAEFGSVKYTGNHDLSKSRMVSCNAESPSRIDIPNSCCR